jgi:hypothetical protein
MRNDPYLRRKKQDMHFFHEKSRFITGRLYSHSRPVEKKKVTDPVDSPDNRGQTLR